MIWMVVDSTYIVNPKDICRKRYL
ncbi:nicotinamide ribonucleoside (NR) uptake permease (PnuC) family protein [Francisella tularensis subsp. tularensis 79201237]|nr:nicotinamide ribonucleoside (NR) uptake permease (PnuC) family protein [Francisella tularensis subsp. tularensis 79201237]EOA40870.1 nicotinamide ribonucleoside (NR) uptake permease (PnuC) family protein [Francisella tularensis subsp. tularensis 80700075]